MPSGHILTPDIISRLNNLSLKDSIKTEIPEELNQFRKDLIAMHNLETD